jgi:hypothetical protein
MIQYDFEFDVKSLDYGKFLQEVHESCPGIEIKDVSSCYLRKSGFSYVSVEVPENIATVLKLRFGQYIKQRPMPVEEDDFEKIKEIIKGIKNITYPYDNPYINDRWEKYYDPWKSYPYIKEDDNNWIKYYKNKQQY